jgi:ribonuclease D
MAKNSNANYELFEDDLSEERLAHYTTKNIVSVDTETRGLVIPRDRLCLVQLCDEDNVTSLVRYNGKPAPKLKKLLETRSVIKLFHFARFDVGTLQHYIGAEVQPIWCTKIASKLVRTYTDKHGLKDLALEFLGIALDKTNQTSDWAQPDLSPSQLAYAASDVHVLIPLYKQLHAMLERENRLELATKLFACVGAVSQADVQGWSDIFAH